MEKRNNKKGRHPQESLLGIFHACRNILPYEKPQNVEDPRYQHSGMTTLFNDKNKINVALKGLCSGPQPLTEKKRGPEQQHLRTTYSSAFTLIELLVVVLIIGILAAVALPQYQVAVAKARLAAVIPVVASMKQAAETYYMANGEYVNDIFAYDVAFPNCNPNMTGHCRRDDGTWFDVSTVSGACNWDVAGVIMNGYDAVNSYGICLDHSHHPGRVYCGAAENDSVANQVCQSLGGTFNRLGMCIATANRTPCNIYLLP